MEEDLKMKLEIQHNFYLIAMERAEKAEAALMNTRRVLVAQRNNMAEEAFTALLRILE